MNNKAGSLCPVGCVFIPSLPGLSSHRIPTCKSGAPDSMVMHLDKKWWSDFIGEELGRELDSLGEELGREEDENE